MKNHLAERNPLTVCVVIATVLLLECLAVEASVSHKIGSAMWVPSLERSPTIGQYRTEKGARLDATGRYTRTFAVHCIKVCAKDNSASVGARHALPASATRLAPTRRYPSPEFHGLDVGDSLIYRSSWAQRNRVQSIHNAGFKPVSAFLPFGGAIAYAANDSQKADDSDTQAHPAAEPLSLVVDRNTIFFTNDNFRSGEILNVENRSRTRLTVGIELPKEGILYDQIIRKPEQFKVPREQWDRFDIDPHSGVFIVLIPEQSQKRLKSLDGREVVIKVYQGKEVRETLSIPIKVSSDLKSRESRRTRMESAPLHSNASRHQAPPTASPSSTLTLTLVVDRKTIFFNNDTLRKGEILNVDNRSGARLSVGIELPKEGLLYEAIIRKPEQVRVPREQWDRFDIDPHSGVFIVLIPEQSQKRLKLLDGREIVIKVYQGKEVRETFRTRIQVAPELMSASAAERGQTPRPSALNLGKALIEAVNQGNVARVRELLGQGAGPNTRDENGWTVLMCAAFTGRTHVVKCLLDRGVNVNARDENGWTALMWAARLSGSQARKKLLPEGADVTAVVKMLIEHKADVKARDTKGWTALMTAAAGGDPEVITLLLDNGAEVKAKDREGWTALMSAAKGGHAEVVELLLNKGAEINEPFKNGWTPLIWAGTEGHKEELKILLDRGADVNAKAKNGRTPLMYVADEGKLETAKLLIEKGADVKAKTADGWTALMSGVQGRNLELVKLLIEKGADVNGRMRNGLTPLILATQKGTLDTVKLLMEKGADVDVKTDDGLTVARVAQQHGRTDVLHYFSEYGLKFGTVRVRGLLTEQLMEAAKNQDMAAVKTILETGVDANTADRDGWTVLMGAAGEKNGLEMTKWLIDKGADVNAKMKNGKTPLMCAVQGGSLDVVRLLIEKGAELNGRDGLGRTALMIAAAKGNEALAEFLIDKGADIHMKNRWGRTALMFAADRGKLKVVDLLIEKGADRKAKNTRGRTALMRAAEKGDMDLMRLLIEKGAEINAKGKDDWTALMSAAMEGRSKALKLLLDKGADVNVQDKEGLTPLMLAAWTGKGKGRIDMVRMLLDKGADVDTRDKLGRTALDHAKEGKHKQIVELLKRHGAKE